MNDNSKKYKIKIHGNMKETERVLSTLFRFGYVFTSRRIKDFKQVESLWYYSIGYGYWEYIILGYDKECKMVMGTLRKEDSTAYEYEDITLEEFVTLKCLK